MIELCMLFCFALLGDNWSLFRGLLGGLKHVPVNHTYKVLVYILLNACLYKLISLPRLRNSVALYEGL